MRMRVRSLALISGLRVWHCCELWCRSQTPLRSGIAVALVQAGSRGSDSIPRLGTSKCRRCGPKKQNKTKNFAEIFILNLEKHLYFLILTILYDVMLYRDTHIHHMFYMTDNQVLKGLCLTITYTWVVRESCALLLELKFQTSM